VLVLLVLQIPVVAAAALAVNNTAQPVDLAQYS
jgi:hypothetical protein